MLPGAHLLKGRKLFFWVLVVFLFSVPALSRSEEEKEGPGIFAVIKDAEGATLEGYLRSYPEELTVASKDNEEKVIPSKFVKSITLEKVREEGAASLDPKQVPKYSVRLENSQEVYTLSKKYTFSLNTSVGVVTRSIDPDTINSLVSRYGSQAPAAGTEKEQPFIQDKSIVFSLEFKF
jgi:hypothetical protein